MQTVPCCPTCNTPLDERSECVTCSAVSQGLIPILRTGYVEVRNMMDLLEGAGLAPEIEQVPPRRPQERAHPHWNLYVPREEAERARDLLRDDWADLLADPDAARAAERGMRGVDLDAGGEIECPACGHRFIPSAARAECPDCGLGLGAAADATPDEAEQA